jgi:signal transduction histidine kinase
MASTRRERSSRGGRGLSAVLGEAVDPELEPPELDNETAEEAVDRADAAERLLRARLLLFAEAEHKLKTSISVILGWAVTLQRHWDQLGEAERLHAVEIIRRRSEGVRDEADRTLKEARAELSVFEVDLECVDVSAALSSGAAALEGLSDRHPLVVDVDESVYAWIDPGGFQQVLAHLVENAVKYSPMGGTITLRLRTRQAWAIVEVADQGSGIPGGVDLFAPFQQGDLGAGGVGLGLSIVNRLVTAMGGTIDARHNDGRGSTFTIRLRRGPRHL